MYNLNRWKEELEKYQVLVMTYSTFMIVLAKSFLKLNQINLLILDECHSIARDPNLKNIFANYESRNSSQPRILGLTASIVNKKCKPIQLSKMIINLETSLHSAIQTSNSILSGLQ